MDADKAQINLEPGLVAATISACLLRGHNAILNRSSADVQTGLNTTH
jgi:hypothetical protein